jgi:hypothetical protein
MFHYTPETYFDWFRSMMKEMNPGTDGGTRKIKLRFAKSARLLGSLGHIDRILENVNQSIACERSKNLV